MIRKTITGVVTVVCAAAALVITPGVASADRPGTMNDGVCRTVSCLTHN